MRTAALLICLAMSQPQAHAEDCFEVGPEDGKIGFTVAQAGAAFAGRFETFGGTVCMDGDAVSRVDAWIEPGSVDAGLPEMNETLRSDEFFAVAEHPRATFDSSSVETSGDGFVVHGSLQVKGISKPMDVPFRLSKSDDGYRVEGSFAIHRLDFEIGTGEWADTTWVGAEATVTFSGTLR